MSRTTSLIPPALHGRGKDTARFGVGDGKESDGHTFDIELVP